MAATRRWKRPQLFRNVSEKQTMKALVTLKRTIDPYVKVRVKSDGSGIDSANVKMAMNPFDEVALEEALRLKESGTITEIVAVTIGPTSAQEVLRNGLALGADRAILIQTENPLQTLDAAKILQKIVNQESPNLVMMGKQSIDNDAGETGQMLAGLLNWPQATFAGKIECKDQKCVVTREIDGGVQTIICDLPCVITTDLTLNTPRHAKLPDIMKSKTKPLDVLTLEQLSIQLSPRLHVLEYNIPPSRQAGTLVNSVEELVDILKNKRKVIP